jgi:cathepsin X
MHDNEITDETCATYTGRGYDNGMDCSPILKCRNCAPHEPCFIPDEYYVYKVDQYGAVKGEDAMVQEIYQRGPISCNIAVTPEFLNYTGGIFKDKTGNKDIDHSISVIGFGVENGQKYWYGRNSWGTHWGINGFFKLARGIDNLAIEEDCSWATPVDTWTTKVTHKTTQAEKTDAKNQNTNGPYPEGFSNSTFL